MIKEQEFLVRHLSPYTRRNYQQVLKQFSEWKPSVPDGNLWVNDYIQFLIGRGLSNKTVNYHINVLSQYRKYLTGVKIEFTRLKELRVQTEFLSEEDVSKILGEAKLPIRALIMVLLDTGCRVGEIERLSATKFDSVPNTTVVMGKGNKQRVIMFSQETIEMLQKTFKGGLLFGEILTIRKVQHRLKRFGERIGLKQKLHPHLFRHTFATRMLWGGVEISDIKVMLGHESLATTERYTHITNERLKHVWEQAFQNRIE